MQGRDQDAAEQDPGRLAGLLARSAIDVSDDPGWQARLSRICTAAVPESGVSGAGVTVMATVREGLAGYRDQLCASDDLSRRLEDLQLTTGEGPCLDAFRGGAPVLVADLAADAARWLGFGPEALAAGAAAVFSIPLQVGAVRLGTLDLHRTVAGALGPEQLAAALELASLATETLLELPVDPIPDADGGAAAGPLPAAGWLPHVHAAVHRASGMVAARERIGVGEALLWLRAYAFAHGEPVNRIAQRVLDRELVLPGPDATTDATTDAKPPDGPATGPADPDVETDP